MSTPEFSFCGVMIFSPSMSLRPDNSSTSIVALSTPLVTSSNGASTVVGASPLKLNLYSPSIYSIRIAFVVVLPQSVASIDRSFNWFFSCFCS